MLLLQADPSQGGMLTDKDVKHTLSLLSNGVYTHLEGKDHNLGLSIWDVAPLLRAISSFLKSISVKNG